MRNTNILDARNLLCPMPVIKTQNTVKSLANGEQLDIMCTDPGALQDIPCWCRINGHKVIDTIHNGHEFTLRIEIFREKN